MAKKPVLCPKASFTQTNTPPRFGQAVASSAAMRETGKKKVKPARIKKKTAEKPYSAVSGQFFTLPIAATLIMATVVVLINRLVWRRMYRLASTRFKLET